MIEYQMTVHVFGNSPSPAIATYGLRRTANESAEVFGRDVAEFVEDMFYVDDSFLSLPEPHGVVDLMQRSKSALNHNGKLRLHKIASNSREVMKAFPAADLAKDLVNLDLDQANTQTTNIRSGMNRLGDNVNFSLEN